MWWVFDVINANCFMTSLWIVAVALFYLTPPWRAIMKMAKEPCKRFGFHDELCFCEEMKWKCSESVVKVQWKCSSTALFGHGSQFWWRLPPQGYNFSGKWSAVGVIQNAPHTCSVLYLFWMSSRQPAAVKENCCFTLFVATAFFCITFLVGKAAQMTKWRCTIDIRIVTIYHERNPSGLLFP